MLTTALALVALPGIAGSQSPILARPFETSALQQLPIPARALSAKRTVFDPRHQSAGFVTPDAMFVEPGQAVEGPIPDRPAVRQPGSTATSVEKPPRFTLTGFASFYDHGTTAMRLPRGTVVVICGAGGCIERRVTDYGPSAAIRPARIADLYRPDFFAVCGCPSWSGTAQVTVKVY